MSETDNGLTEYLASHPRMTGGLFMLLLLLSQAGTVAAGSSGVVGGP